MKSALDVQSAPDRKPKRSYLEQTQRLSRSLLWRLQRQFFETHGVEAWRQEIVPHYVTSNPYLAHAYAKVVFGFLRDCAAVARAPENTAFPALDLSQPIYIVELGAGSGRFAYHFLKKFTGFFRQSVLQDIPVQYVMTDFAQRTVTQWREHPSLKPFIEDGRLDFALFDAEHPGELALLHSGQTLAPGTVRNPLIVLANYFFDSIPQDSFTLEEGQLFENLISLSAPQPEPDLGAPNLLERLEIAYTLRPASVDYYADPDFNRILQAYQAQFADATFTFPCAALECLRHFNRLSGGRWLLLSGDKGYIQAEALCEQGEPELNLHGSFSLMVNYHALAQYTLNQGGAVLQTSHQHASLSISAFLLGRPPRDYPETRQAYTEGIAQGGPDDFFMLKKGLEPHYGMLTLPQLLAYLRLSGWDANIFLGACPAFLSQAASASEALRLDLYEAIYRVWDIYYPLGEERDVPFHLGMLLQALEFYSEAVEFYEHSLRLCGPDPSTFYNLGQCHANQGRPEAALANINRALEMDPDFEAAQSLRLVIQSEITPAARAVGVTQASHVQTSA